jgi:hypothetical protein
MPRKLEYRSRRFDEVPQQPARFAVGDAVQAVDDGTPGTVDFTRRDGMVCVTWDHSGRREWVPQDQLEGKP